MVKPLAGRRITAPPPPPRPKQVKPDFRTVHIDAKQAVTDLLVWTSFRERAQNEWLRIREAANVDHCAHVEALRYRQIASGATDRIIEEAKAKLIVLGLA
ncbi:hypothetical protein [Burkholderia phage vB_BglM_WTB]